MTFVGDAFVESIAGIVGLVVGLAVLIKHHPRSRSRLKEDLEILKLIEKDSDDHAIVHRYVSQRIEDIYGERVLRIEWVYLGFAVWILFLFMRLYFDPNTGKNENVGYLLFVLAAFGLGMLWVSFWRDKPSLPPAKVSSEAASVVPANSPVEPSEKSE